MKFHTSLTETEVRACLERAKSDGDMPADVEFDVFGTAGSRTHPRAYEIHLATSQRDTRADGKTRSSSPLAGGNGLRYAATYDEWGYFLAEFFAADPAAKAGPYKSKADFHARTQYAYAMGMDELPAGTRPADPEPEPEYASTRPTTRAMLPVIERIDATLAGYRTPNHP